MSYFRCIFNKNPDSSISSLRKLIIGGVHGNEGEKTIEVIKSLKVDDFSIGKSFIYNFDKSEYISTLNKKYYRTPKGIEILNLIKKHDPDFYIELHSYNPEHYERLTSEERIKKKGVPPLIDLNNKILIGSASPLIRKKLFKKNSVCITLEIPSKNGEKIQIDKINEILKVLKLFTKAENRLELEREIDKYYPNKKEIAEKYAKIIFGNYPAF